MGKNDLRLHNASTDLGKDVLQFGIQVFSRAQVRRSVFMPFDPAARNLVSVAKFLQSILQRHQLVQGGFLLLKIPHNHNAKISCVLVFDVGPLILERTTLPNVATAIDGEVITNVIPISFQVTLLDASQAINRTSVIMSPFPQ